MSADQPLTGDELATIKARAEAVPVDERAWRRIGKYGVEAVPAEAFMADGMFEHTAEHIAGMDPATTLRLVAEIERLQAQVERVEKFQQGLVVLGNLPIEKRPDGLTGGIEACAALADDLRVTLDGP